MGGQGQIISFVSKLLRLFRKPKDYEDAEITIGIYDLQGNHIPRLNHLYSHMVYEFRGAIRNTGNIPIAGTLTVFIPKECRYLFGDGQIDEDGNLTISHESEPLQTQEFSYQFQVYAETDSLLIHSATMNQFNSNETCHTAIAVASPNELLLEKFLYEEGLAQFANDGNGKAAFLPAGTSFEFGFQISRDAPSTVGQQVIRFSDEIAEGITVDTVNGTNIGNATNVNFDPATRLLTFDVDVPEDTGENPILVSILARVDSDVADGQSFTNRFTSNYRNQSWTSDVVEITASEEPSGLAVTTTKQAVDPSTGDPITRIKAEDAVNFVIDVTAPEGGGAVPTAIIQDAIDSDFQIAAVDPPEATINGQDVELVTSLEDGESKRLIISCKYEPVVEEDKVVRNDAQVLDENDNQIGQSNVVLLLGEARIPIEVVKSVHQSTTGQAYPERYPLPAGSTATIMLTLINREPSYQTVDVVDKMRDNWEYHSLEQGATSSWAADASNDVTYDAPSEEVRSTLDLKPIDEQGVSVTRLVFRAAVKQDAPHLSEIKNSAGADLNNE